MSFRVGQIIVHPFHGPVRIRSTDDRLLRGVREPFLHMESLDGHLRISVPAARADDVGLRATLSPDQVNELFDVLRAESIPLERQWSRRMKDLQARVASGQILEIAIVVRELIRKGIVGKATAEGQLLTASRTQIATELAIALDGEAVEVCEQMIEGAALGMTPSSRQLVSA